MLRPFLGRRGDDLVANEPALARLASELTTKFSAPELYDMLKQLGLAIEGIRRLSGGATAAEQVTLTLFVPVTQAVVQSARGEVVARQKRKSAQKKPDGLAPPSTKGAGLRR